MKRRPQNSRKEKWKPGPCAGSDVWGADVTELRDTQDPELQHRHWVDSRSKPSDTTPPWHESRHELARRSRQKVCKVRTLSWGSKRLAFHWVWVWPLRLACPG